MGVQLLLVGVAHRRAVDDDGGAPEGLHGLVLGAVAQFLEGGETVGVHRQGGAPPDEVVHLGALGDQRSPLVKGDLVDAEMLPVVGEHPDQGLTDGAGAHHMDDLGHLLLPVVSAR